MFELSCGLTPLLSCAEFNPTLAWHNHMFDLCYVQPHILAELGLAPLLGWAEFNHTFRLHWI